MERMDQVSESVKIGKKLAPFNPAGSEVVQTALELLNIVDYDILYDLGCGDARLLVQACGANPTVRGVGIEYDSEIYERACNLVRGSGLSEHQVSIRHDNVLNVDFSEATCIFVYLVPEGMAMLKNAFLDCLDRGVRIVSYVFSIPDLTPIEVRVYKGSTKIYLYRKEPSTAAAGAQGAAAAGVGAGAGDGRGQSSVADQAMG